MARGGESCVPRVLCGSAIDWGIGFRTAAGSVFHSIPPAAACVLMIDCKAENHHRHLFFVFQANKRVILKTYLATPAWGGVDVVL